MLTNLEESLAVCKKTMNCVDHLIPQEAIIKYMSHPTVLMVHSDLQRPDFEQSIKDDLTDRLKHLPAEQTSSHVPVDSLCRVQW